MKQTTRNALATLLSAFGAALNALAAEIGGGASETATEETPAPVKRGRKAAASATQESTSPTQTTTAAETTPAQNSNGAAEESPEENQKRYERNRELIKPHVMQAGKSQTVKDIIAKYSANGLRELPAKDQEAFEKDIEGLAY